MAALDDYAEKAGFDTHFKRLRCWN